MSNDVWVREWARVAIKTRCASRVRADALAELDRASSAELALLVCRYLDEWQDPVQDRYYLRALAADRGDTGAAELIAAVVADRKRREARSVHFVHRLGDRRNCSKCGEWWPCAALNIAFAEAYPSDAR